MAESSSLFGRYELIKRIARGGMAEIYLATERGLQGLERQVALKRILPHMAESEDFITMFMDEARVAARLAHPNIAHIYNFGEVDEVYYLAMEYVEGLTCSKLLKLCAPEPISIPITLRVVADVCAALHYAHEMRGSDGAPLGLVHRDVNPQNVMVSVNGVAKLLDFGVARAATQSHATRVGQVKGKIGYIAPEVFRGQPIDRRADIFACGTMLFELLSGRKLFRRELEAATIHAILNDDPPPLAGQHGNPDEVDEIIGRAVAKDPAERYQTALEMQQDIEMLIARRGIVATPFVVGQFVRESMTLVRKRRAAEDGSQPPSVSSAGHASEPSEASSSVSESSVGSVSSPREEADAGKAPTIPAPPNETAVTMPAAGAGFVVPPPAAIAGLTIPTPGELGARAARTPAAGVAPPAPPLEETADLSLGRGARTGALDDELLMDIEIPTIEGLSKPSESDADRAGSKPSDEAPAPSLRTGQLSELDASGLVPDPSDFDDQPTTVAPRPMEFELEPGDHDAPRGDGPDAGEPDGGYRPLEAIEPDADATRKLDLGEVLGDEEPTSQAPLPPTEVLAPPDIEVPLEGGFDTGEPTQEMAEPAGMEPPAPAAPLQGDATLEPPEPGGVTVETAFDDVEDELLAGRRRNRFLLLVALLGLGVVAVVTSLILILGGGGERTEPSSPDGTGLASVGGETPPPADASAGHVAPPTMLDAGVVQPPTPAAPDAGGASGEPQGERDTPSKAPPPGRTPTNDGRSRTKEPERSHGGSRSGPPGQLFLHTSPYSKVRVAGRYLGTTPIVGAKLPPGNHTLLLTDPSGKVHRRRVRIRPGAATKMSLKLR